MEALRERESFIGKRKNEWSREIQYDCQAPLGFKLQSIIVQSNTIQSCILVRPIVVYFTQARFYHAGIVMERGKHWI